MFVNPEIVAEAKRTFEKEIEGMPFRSMLPSNQKPPVGLNAATMAKYRDAMPKNYVKEQVVFT